MEMKEILWGFCVWGGGAGDIATMERENLRFAFEDFHSGEVILLGIGGEFAIVFWLFFFFFF